MLTLHLVRHAKASSEEYFPGDFFRTLNEEGYSEAQQISSEAAAKLPMPKIMMSSPAIRAYTTAQIFARGFSVNPDQIILNHAIYDAGYAKLLRVLREFADNLSSVMLFGHNPGFTDLLNFLCGTNNYSMSTAQIVTLEVNVRSWNEVDAGTANIIFSRKP